jgi:hypothetical protein
LVSVTDFRALVKLTIWLPKSSEAGETFITGGGAMPVPVRVKVCVEVGAQPPQLT